FVQRRCRGTGLAPGAQALFGGARPADRPRRVPLEHGDVVVWGGPTRLRYYGIMSLADVDHSLTGSRRFNLTSREHRDRDTAFAVASAAARRLEVFAAFSTDPETMRFSGGPQPRQTAWRAL